MDQSAKNDSSKEAKTGENDSKPVLRENPTEATEPNPTAKDASDAHKSEPGSTVESTTKPILAKESIAVSQKPILPSESPIGTISRQTYDNRRLQSGDKTATTTPKNPTDGRDLSNKRDTSAPSSQKPAENTPQTVTVQTTTTGSAGDERATTDAPPKQPLTSQAAKTASVIVKNPAASMTKSAPTGTATVDSKPAPTIHVSTLPSSAATTAPAPSTNTTTTIPKPSDTAQDRPSHETDPLKPKAASLVQNRVAPPATTSSKVAKEAAIDAARRPLTNLYGDYICKSKDKSLEDARARLRKAIVQTHELRKAFTDRVYEKYRVCLKPPPTTEEIFGRIAADPEGQVVRLKEEADAQRAEKEIERKEAAKLNSEIAASSVDRSVLANVDNAEQIMFMTAGLSLVILPEDKADPNDVSGYAERAPIDHITGQRAKNLSQAAAMSGEVILDRTRKAAAMRVERQRRQQLKLLRGEAAESGDADNSYSRLQILAGTKPSSMLVAAANTATKSAKGFGRTSGSKAAPKASAATAQPTKSARSRTQTSLTTSVLLSLHATADQVAPDGKPKAATVALMTRGIGSAAKSTQQRLRHPHPESLGGRRRASVNPTKKDPNTVNPSEPFQQAFLANTLPPLPASKERTERKPLPVESFDPSRNSSAQMSVSRVLQQFVQTEKEAKLQTLSKISFLDKLRQITSPSQGASNSTNDSTVDPAVTVSVLHALGLITQTQDRSGQRSSFKISNLVTENKALYSDRFKSLCSEIGSNSKATTTNLFFGSSDIDTKKRVREEEDLDSSKKPRTEKPTDAASSLQSVPVQNIRGGGEVLSDTKESKPAAKSGDKKKSGGAPQKRKRSDSSPETLSSPSETPQTTPAASVPKKVTQDKAQKPAATVATTAATPSEQYHAGAAANAYHLAAQLGHMHHPAAGDLAGYLGNLQQQQGYALSGLIPSPSPAQLSALGFGQQPTGRMGYALQDGAVAARAMLLREQQAAALLGYQPPAGFGHLATHPAAMSAFLGVKGDPTMMGQPEAASEGASTKRKQNHKKKSASQTKTKSNAEAKEAPEDTRPLKRQKTTDAAKQESAKNVSATTVPAEVKDEAGTAKGTDSSSPAPLSPTTVDLVRSGRFHLAVTKLEASKQALALDFLVTLAQGIPIPNGLISGPLKERLDTPGFRSHASNGEPLIKPGIVGAAVIAWLWSNHESPFQKALKSAGRLDLDPPCKWLMQVAIDSAVSELALAIADSVSGKGEFAEAAATNTSSGVFSTTQPTPLLSEISKKLDVRTASIVSRALNAKLQVDGDLNSIFPKYEQFVELLDTARLGALRAKSQERTLLANLLARKSAMTENFSNAYASSMVRAGEALGHGKLFETVQDEPTSASTMMPYDIFTDESGSWEDPCKRNNGFSAGLTGDELYRRAHGRAMIQRSLKKLQDKHQIRGGTSIYGPFVDPADAVVTREGFSDGARRPMPSPRYGGGRRRASSMIESIPPGTGSAPAGSWAIYEPNHLSSPFYWDIDDEGNTPYGIHSKLQRKQSLSLSGKTVSKSRIRSMSFPMSALTTDDTSKSTNEIDWKQVASIFQSVELPQKPARSKSKSSHGHGHDHEAAHSGPIVAPLCRELDDEFGTGDSEPETEEEDISEESILAKHQIVLNEMKGKLDAFLAARKKQQDRRKNRGSKG